MMLRLPLLLLLLAAGWSEGLKILGVFPLASYSHYTPVANMMKELVKRGHEVTVLAPYEDKKAKFQTIHLTGFAEDMEEVKKAMNMFEMRDQAWYTQILMLHFMGYDITNKTLNHPNVLKLLKSNQKFDVVIIEQFGNEALRGLCQNYGAACVLYSPISTMYWTNLPMGNPDNPAYIPAMTLSIEGDRMTFLDRVKNTFLYVFTYITYYNVLLPQQASLVKEHFPNSPSLMDTLYDVDLVLVNSYPGMSPALPFVPNMIEIGGHHIRPAQKLPEDLQKYLDEAKEGVILFSMGSVLRSQDMGEKNIKIFLKAFSKLKQKVLWKLETDLPETPPNVKLMKWVPQRDVLAHPNVIAFITHSGLSSSIESLYLGVPTVAIPIFGDQQINAKRAFESGYSVTIDYLTLSEESLTKGLNEIINNKKYSENAKRRSEVLQDQPQTPLDRAIFWIEYSARHRGSKHRKSAIIDLHWYQYLLLDVIGFFVVALGLVFYIIRRLLRSMCGLCFGKKNSGSSKKKTN